ncbi:MAG: hypothetical protein U0271_38950 [Polyangiaceae bacterium]
MKNGAYWMLPAIWLGTSLVTGCHHSGGSGGAGGESAGGTGAGGSGTGGALDAYLVNCDSLFAARILEKQIEQTPGSPEDCDEPLASDIGELTDNGNALCRAGESPNACRQRLYDTPPDIRELKVGCASANPPEDCLIGKYLPKCADGTDTSCGEPEAICQDGTRPYVNVEPATNGASNVWIFYMGGEGNPCDGPLCWLNYRYKYLQGDWIYEASMSSNHPDYHNASAGVTGDGIMNGTSNPANPFAKYNRVKVKRCTEINSDAVETVPFGDGLPAALADMIPPDSNVQVATRSSETQVWHRGLDTWLSMLHSFATAAGRDLDGDGNPDLPSLANATQVVLAGSSDASGSLVMVADRLAEEIRSIAGSDVDVRIMIDAGFGPSLDDAGRYAPQAPANFNMFANPYDTTQLCSIPDNMDGADNESCSDLQYRPGPLPDGGETERDALDARGVRADESCAAMHGPDAPECFDEKHVLFQHLETPFLVLSDQEDSVVKKAGCNFDDSKTYYEWTDREDFRARVLNQGRDFAAYWGTNAREEGPGGDVMLMLAKSARSSQPWTSAQHVHFDNNEEMLKGMTLCNPNKTVVATASFAQGVDAWLTGAAPVQFVMEDASAWDGASPYWVTGPNCIDPE